MKKTYEIETSPTLHKRIERFLALLHHNSNFGHSGLFAMPLDGDGADKVSVSPKPEFPGEVNLIGGVGYHVEIAYDDCYSGWFMDRNKACKWKTGQIASLRKDGEIIETSPRMDPAPRKHNET